MKLLRSERARQQSDRRTVRAFFVVAKLQKSAYADLIRQAFGEGIFENPQMAFDKAVQALQAFQLEDYSFHPYSSKFDLFAANKLGGKLTPAERRGFVVFNNPRKGNCFSCHFSGAGLNGSTGMFAVWKLVVAVNWALNFARAF